MATTIDGAMSASKPANAKFFGCLQVMLNFCKFPPTSVKLSINPKMLHVAMKIAIIANGTGTLKSNLV